MALWGIELSPLDIVYEKRHAIKSQVLPDFLVHWMELQLPDTPDMTQSWTMHSMAPSARLEQEPGSY